MTNIASNYLRFVIPIIIILFSRAGEHPAVGDVGTGGDQCPGGAVGLRPPH